MKKLVYLLRVVWAYWYFVVFALGFLLFYPLFLIWLSNEKHYAKANSLRRLWARLQFTATGIFYDVRHEAKLNKKQAYVFCPNHFSYLDIPLFAICVKGNFRFMAKVELGKIPLFKIFFRTIDISVDRGNAAEGARALKQASESLDKGMDLIIFPEGKIGDHPPKLERFKNGAFRLAIEKQVPVVPITFIDNWKLLYVGGKIHGRPGTARAIVHRPIPTKGMTLDDTDTLKQTVYNIIEKTLKEYEGR